MPAPESTFVVHILCLCFLVFSVIEKCIADVRSWFIGNRLMINDAKTDFLIIGTRQQLEKNIY